MTKYVGLLAFTALALLLFVLSLDRALGAGAPRLRGRRR